MVEIYEENIEDWYKNHRKETTLTDFLCERTMLKADEKSCLTEVFVPTAEEKKEAKPTKETPPKNDRDSKVIKEAIDNAVKNQQKTDL